MHGRVSDRLKVRLSRIKYASIDVRLDIKGLTDVKEDDVEDMEPVRVEEEGVTECDRDVIKEIRKHAREWHRVPAEIVNAGRHHILVFGAKISHVRRLEAAFTEALLKSHHVTSKTPLAERDRLLKGFAAGDFPILINCGVFAEGTDIPSVSCVT
jgi:superfamily II DNA or RNA helicase